MRQHRHPSSNWTICVHLSTFAFATGCFFLHLIHLNQINRASENKFSLSEVLKNQEPFIRERMSFLIIEVTTQCS